MEPSMKLTNELDLQLRNHCYTENQRWSVILTSYEQEIDQLLSLLDGVLDQYIHQNLRYRAVDYHQCLNRLKAGFNHLYTENICAINCCEGRCLPCGEARFGRYAIVPNQFASISDEFGRIKAGCYQFLSVLVQLNLL